MWDIYTQGVASLYPGLSACYPFRELTLALRQRKVFILVYRLAMDAKTLWGDGGAGGKYPSLLERFSVRRSIYGS